MHVSTLVSPTSAPRSDARPDAFRPGGARASGFGEVYGESARVPAPERRDPESARETAERPAKDERPAAAETETPEAAVDAGAEPAGAAPVVAAGEAPSPEDAPMAEEPGEGPAFPANAAASAAGAAPVPVRSPAAATGQALHSERAGTVPAASPVPTEAVLAQAVPQPFRPGDQAPASDDAAKPAAQASARAAALPSEDVTVRRLRADEAAESGGASTVATVSRPGQRPVRPVPAILALADAMAKPAETAATTAADPSSQVADATLAEVGAADARTPAAHAARIDAAARPAPAHPVAQQMAEAARALGDGPVELTLKPEELGTVRMTLHAGPDGAMTMSLQAERPETLDLLRRHVGELARELQQAGYGNLSFSFGQGRPDEGRHGARAAAEAADHPVAAIPLAAQGFAARPASTAGGLDLRL